MTDKLYQVDSREVWIQRTYILAETSQQAVELVREGGGVQGESGSSFEYSHTLDGRVAAMVHDRQDIKFFVEFLQEGTGG